MIGVIGISCGRGIGATESGNDMVDVCGRFIVFTGPAADAGTGADADDGSGADADEGGFVEVVVVVVGVEVEVVVVLVGVEVTIFDGLGCGF